LDTATFTITLTGGDLTRWKSAADRRGISLELLVLRAVERELAG